MLIELTPYESEILHKVGQTAQRLNVSAFAVGGFVRDKLLNRSCKDIDIVCVGSGIELAQKVKEDHFPNAPLVFLRILALLCFVCRNLNWNL
jgi:poly(A) polymerase